MRLRALAFGAIAASIVVIPAAANAAWGQATGDVNMRACNSAQCQKVGVVPAGAQVWINGSQGGWYNVTFQGRQGFVSGRYIATGYAQAPGTQMGRPDIGPAFAGSVNPARPPSWQGSPPNSGYWQNPWWDNRHNAWYDGRRWYRNGIWYNDPSGFSFGFTFGG